MLRLLLLESATGRLWSCCCSRDAATAATAAQSGPACAVARAAASYTARVHACWGQGAELLGRGQINRENGAGRRSGRSARGRGSSGHRHFNRAFVAIRHAINGLHQSAAPFTVCAAHVDKRAGLQPGQGGEALHREGRIQLELGGREGEGADRALSRLEITRTAEWKGAVSLKLRWKCSMHESVSFDSHVEWLQRMSAAAFAGPRGRCPQAHRELRPKREDLRNGNSDSWLEFPDAGLRAGARQISSASVNAQESPGIVQILIQRL